VKLQLEMVFSFAECIGSCVKNCYVIQVVLRTVSNAESLKISILNYVVSIEIENIEADPILKLKK